MATITGPASVLQAIRAVDTPRDPARDRCPQPNPCSTKLGLSDARPRRPISSDVFRRHQRGAGADGDVCWRPGLCPVDLTRTESNNQQCPFGTGQRLRRWPGHSVFEASKARRWRATQQRWPPRPCRALMDAPCCAQRARVFGSAVQMHAPWGSHLRRLMPGCARRNRRRPWYPRIPSFDPNILGSNPAAIGTRVAPVVLSRWAN